MSRASIEGDRKQTVNAPTPFAVMARAHSAFRTGLHALRRRLADDDPRMFADEWREFKHAINVHMVMEDHGLFPLLREIASKQMHAANLEAEHAEDLVLQARIDRAIVANDSFAMSGAFEDWQCDFLAHLEHEEAVVVPLIGRLGADGQERARIFNSKILQPALDHGGFERFLAYVLKQLHEPESAAAFTQGLQLGTTAEQWQRYLPVVQEHTRPPGG
jgi:iron-sulfur cluster repair protein YtfE (RIC family)